MIHYKSGKKDKHMKTNVEETADNKQKEVVDRKDDKTVSSAKDNDQSKNLHEKDTLDPVDEIEIPASFNSDEKETPTIEITSDTSAEDDLNFKINDLNDRYLRLYSEFDNYRKRTLKERIELSKTASEDVIRALLPVVDDFERALKSWASVGEDDEVHLEGIKLINNKLQNILSQRGLEEISAIGLPFNTDFHEAITQIPAPTPELKDKIVDVVEKGYTLQGKVIRFAKVVVGS